MDIQDAVDNFATAMHHCDNLIAVHKAPNKGPGRRTTETSINRGTIVLAVASWQAFIQDVATVMADEAMSEVHAVTGAPLLASAMKQWKTDFDKAHRDFSTPGPSQSQALLKRIGFDPRSSWTWTQNGGRGNASVLVEPWHVEKVINQWLRVRHDVAHGHSTITSLPILGAVRDPKSSAKAKAAPTLRLDDAEDCVRFFRSIVRLTADAAAQHLSSPPPRWESLPPLALGLHISHIKP